MHTKLRNTRSARAKNSGTGDSGENCTGLTWVQRAMVRAYDQEQAAKKFEYSVTDPCLEA